MKVENFYFNDMLNAVIAIDVCQALLLTQLISQSSDVLAKKLIKKHQSADLFQES